MCKRKKGYSNGLTCQQKDLIEIYIIRFRLSLEYEKMDTFMDLLESLDLMWDSIINYPDFTNKMEKYLDSYIDFEYKNEQPYYYSNIKMYRNKWFR